MYHGFRYIGVNLTSKPALSDAEGLVIRTDSEAVGSVVTSDTMLNDIHRIIDRTIQSILARVWLLAALHFAEELAVKILNLFLAPGKRHLAYTCAPRGLRCKWTSHRRIGNRITQGHDWAFQLGAVRFEALCLSSHKELIPSSVELR